MGEQFLAIDNISQVLLQQSYPTITMWNRLEGRPRALNFDRALRAEVRDALWMLTKQWQMGEFQGDDCGSPLFTKVSIASTRLNKYRAGKNPVQSFEDEVPLEAKVEQKSILLSLGGQKMALDLRLQMGRQWLKLAGQVGNFTQAYLKRYPIKMPDPDNEADSRICAHQEVWAQFAAVAGRAMDGGALWAYLKASPSHHAYDGIPVPKHLCNKIDQAAAKFIQWFDSLYYQPQKAENEAWIPSCLEYQFSCSAPEEEGEKVLVADEYYQGHLDWYNLDISPRLKFLGDAKKTPPQETRSQGPLSFIPTPISFEGMPNTRWWTFEDRRTNFGNIKPDTIEIAKLLLIDFMLVYANDWFLFPLTLPAGSIARIKGLALTNVFGERFWIEPAGSGSDEDWQRWSMFTLNIKGHADLPADLSMLLLPTVPKILESKPVEEIALVRDELANMVWGVETIVPLPDGSSKPGNEAAIELRRHLQGLLDKDLGQGVIQTTPKKYQASIRYQVMTSVPEHWIPFIPVHVPGDNREIQLQRAAMPRLLEGDPNPPEKVHPRTALMREGLDYSPARAYFLHEEEVPRAGVRVSQSFQRTRWYNGRVFIWLGARKQTGRGEGSSGLAFDQIVPTEKTTE
jgi:hypothetical protein